MRLLGLFLLALGFAPQTPMEPMPSDLSALVAGARLEGSVVSWCRGEFRPGDRDWYALAVTSAEGGGRYVVIEPNAAVTELASYTDGAEVSCYTPARARQLDTTIKVSETIEGGVKPRWKTTVICGFVEDTRATCWQYSPALRTFVKVGGWIT